MGKIDLKLMFVQWKPSVKINVESKSVFENYREYNLKKANNYYLYEVNKMNKIDYINKNTELKNIYRSYVALCIFLAKDNLDLILDVYESSL